VHQIKSNPKTSEEWLDEAVGQLRNIFEGYREKVPRPPYDGEYVRALKQPELAWPAISGTERFGTPHWNKRYDIIWDIHEILVFL